MPPGRVLKTPACANPYAIAIEPSAVTPHESSEIAPTCAMFVGSRMIPEPIMFTATRNVRCIRLIFFWSCTGPSASFLIAPSLLDYVGMELDAALDALLEYALHLVVEPRE